MSIARQKMRSFTETIGRLCTDLDFVTMVVLAVVFAVFCIRMSFAVEPSKGVRTVHLDQTTVARIAIAPGRSTILSFPSKPVKVILGSQGVFAVEYVENDLAVAALSGRAHSDLFVYLDGRRFAFDLEATVSKGDTIVLVRDAAEPTKPIPRESSSPKKKGKSG